MLSSLCSPGFSLSSRVSFRYATWLISTVSKPAGAVILYLPRLSVEVPLSIFERKMPAVVMGVPSWSVTLLYSIPCCAYSALLQKPPRKRVIHTHLHSMLEGDVL